MKKGKEKTATGEQGGTFVQDLGGRRRRRNTSGESPVSFQPRPTISVLPSPLLVFRFSFLVFLSSFLVFRSPTVTFAAPTAEKAYHLPFYDQCTALPTDTLLSMGARFSDDLSATDSALVCYSVVANRYYQHNLDAAGTAKSIGAMNRLGYLFMYNHFDYEKSYAYLMEALELSRKHHIDTFLPYIHQNLAGLYAAEGEGQGQIGFGGKSLSLYREAFDEAVRLKDDRVAVSLFINLLGTMLRTPDLQREHALLCRIRHGGSVEMLLYALTLYDGNALMEKGCYAEALDSYRRLPRLIHTSSAPMANRYRMMALGKGMQALFAMGEDAKALDKLQQLLRLACQTRARDVVVSAYHVFYEYYHDRHQTALANEYYGRYLENKDSLLTYDKRKGIADLNFQMQLNRANNQVRTLSYKRRTDRMVLWAVVVFAGIIAVVLVFLVRSYRQLRQKNRKLYEKNVAFINEMRKARQLQHLHAAPEACRDGGGEATAKEKYSGSRLGDDTRALLERRISDIIDNSDEMYETSFSLRKLADRVGSNQSYVSQVVNEKYGKSFNTLLGECRINEACRRMGDAEHYGHYTIEAIAKSVGFKSRTSFAASFKKITGLTPSTYQRMAREAGGRSQP